MSLLRSLANGDSCSPKGEKSILPGKLPCLSINHGRQVSRCITLPSWLVVESVGCSCCCCCCMWWVLIDSPTASLSTNCGCASFTVDAMTTSSFRLLYSEQKGLQQQTTQHMTHTYRQL